ncbi:MAG TPA: anion permease [Steroidobacteraceae bacterium]|nr:anion permease [Steroidobacteraceae bacterium]
MNIGRILLLAAISLVALAYIGRWWWLERARGADPARPRRPRFSDLMVGFVTNFFDTLGIGCFAPTTAYFKLRARMPDDEIPGTLNTGHALPAMAEALIFIAVVSVDMTTLVSMIVAAVLGAWLGVGIVSGLSRRAIQLGMGGALMCAALLFLIKNLDWMPGSGDALALHGPTLIFAVGVNFLLGALMMLGVGLFAPCLILVSLLGMSPLAAFPIMMGSCALLMPVGGARFVKSGRYNVSAAVGLAIGGIPGVLVAAYIVRSLPTVWLRWLVLVVVLYAAVQMLRSARRSQSAVEPQRASPS